MSVVVNFVNRGVVVVKTSGDSPLSSTASKAQPNRAKLYGGACSRSRLR